MHRIVHALAARSFALALLAALAAADVTILGSPTSYPTIQAAVDAGQDGDVLLVSPGNYGAFVIDGKGLTVLGQGLVHVSGTCEVRNLAASDSCALVQLTVVALNSYVSAMPGLRLSDDAGTVRVQGCSFTGGLHWDSFQTLGAGDGITATNCAHVVISGSTLTGRDGGQPSGEQPAAGGDGLRSTDSALALYDCTLRGGRGTEETYPSGGTGGNGCTIEGWGLLASGCTILGGTGGGGDYLGCTTSGNGGDALFATASQVRLLDNTIIAGGAGNFGPCGLGSPGQAIHSNGAVVTQLSGARRKLSGPTSANDHSSVTFTFTGQPGDSVWLLRSQRQTFQFLSSFVGIATIPLPWMITVQPLGTIGASGTVQCSVPFADYPAGQAGFVWYLQGLAFDTAGKRFLATPLQFLLLNP